jgi:hypothetical protein
MRCIFLTLKEVLRMTGITHYFAEENDPNLLNVLFDVIRHCVIQKRANKLGLGTV